VLLHHEIKVPHTSHATHATLNSRIARMNRLLAIVVSGGLQRFDAARLEQGNCGIECESGELGLVEIELTRRA
jgi:hypothetical protein